MHWPVSRRILRSEASARRVNNGRHLTFDLDPANATRPTQILNLLALPLAA